jgi:hypothetical protein
MSSIRSDFNNSLELEDFGTDTFKISERIENLKYKYNVV